MKYYKMHLGVPCGPGFPLQVLTALRFTPLRSGLSAAIPNAIQIKWGRNFKHGFVKNFAAE